ncbi:MAG: type II toxin-antitoxin system RelE/ParE family toxin [Myxococcaceae bacterium]|nr:type II toxin-antitoxin system RelE/ParE family toxin [Myxococcaceae bacterium]MCI0671723.1 type II toxin-antitoxin system RelE/ParE family toxin [Myxococcaceae bacterium]
MKVVFAPEAEADLLAALAFLAKRNPVAAARLAARVLTTVGRLADGEFDGPEQLLASGERVRSWPVPPWRIYYQRQADALLVLRVYHHARRPMVRRSRRRRR